MPEIKLKPKIDVVRHYLGPFNEEERVQRCIICGEIIHDYRGSVYAPNPDGSPIVERGWEPGAHYIMGKNPQYFSTTMPPKDGYNIILCSINRK